MRIIVIAKHEVLWQSHTNELYKSIHFGFNLNINFSLFALDHDFNCFSLVIAASISSKNS